MSRSSSASSDGGQDEDAHQVALHGLGKLLAALPIDVEDHVAAGIERAFHRVARGAVPVTEHLRAFEERPALPQAGETGLVDKVIVPAVDLVRPLGPRGVRDRDFHPVAFELDKAAGDRRLAGTGGRGQHQQETAAPENRAV